MIRPVEPWFRDAVIDGVTFLYSLALRGAPAAEVVTLTTTGWIDVLWRRPVQWTEELDAPRIGPAFLSLAGAVDAWPAPRALLDHLPQRDEQQPVMLPAPDPTPERRAMLAALRRRVTDRLSSPVRMTHCANANERGADAPLDRVSGMPTSDGKLAGAGMSSATETAKDAAVAPLGRQQ